MRPTPTSNGRPSEHRAARTCARRRGRLPVSGLHSQAGNTACQCVAFSAKWAPCLGSTVDLHSRPPDSLKLGRQRFASQDWTTTPMALSSQRRVMSIAPRGDGHTLQIGSPPKVLRCGSAKALRASSGGELHLGENKRRGSSPMASPYALSRGSDGGPLNRLVFGAMNRDQGHWHKNGTLALRRRSSVCKRESTGPSCQKKVPENQGLVVQWRWWVLRGSNPRPTPCKGAALPTELSTHCAISSVRPSGPCPDETSALWPT